MAGVAVVVSTALFGGPSTAVATAPRNSHALSGVHFGPRQIIDPLRGEPVALSCPTVDFCAAVVRDNDGPARLVRYGGGQSIVTATQDKRTKTVACGTAQFCVAGPADAAYVWDGTDWTGPQALGSDLDRPALGDELGASPVCAPGTAMCVYIGKGTSVVHDAFGWHSVALPDGFDRAVPVSCATATFCEALNLGTSSGQAAHFDGASWHRDPDPFAQFGHWGGIVPDVISCATPTYCMAVDLDSGGTQTFDGTTWTRFGGDGLIWHASQIVGLTCVADGECVGVDNHVESADHQEAYIGLITLANGTVQVAGQRNVSTGIRDLSCPTQTLCRAVDVQGDIYTIDHGAWAAVDHLLPTTGILTDVSCASPTWCMAVDARGNALLWSDGRWSGPVKIDGNEYLIAVSCSASRVCVAIDADHGDNVDAVRSGARAIRYSAGQWHTPQVVDTNSRLHDVSCPTAHRCVIVDDNGQVIVRGRDGWHAPSMIAQSLVGISCLGKSFCVATGESPAVSCLGKSFCVATGESPAVSVFVDGRWKALLHPPAVPTTVDCPERRYCLVVAEPVTYVLGAHGWHETEARGARYPGAGQTSLSCGTRRFCVLDVNRQADLVYKYFPAYLVRGTHSRRLPRPGAHVSCVQDMCMQVRLGVAYVLTDR